MGQDPEAVEQGADPAETGKRVLVEFEPAIRIDAVEKPDIEGPGQEPQRHGRTVGGELRRDQPQEGGPPDREFKTDVIVGEAEKEEQKQERVIERDRDMQFDLPHPVKEMTGQAGQDQPQGRRREQIPALGEKRVHQLRTSIPPISARPRTTRVFFGICSLSARNVVWLETPPRNGTARMLTCQCRGTRISAPPIRASTLISMLSPSMSA